ALLPLVRSDLVELLLASAEGRIKNYDLEVNSEYCCCVVIASRGYPDKYESGKEIMRIESINSDCLVLHSGTKVSENGKLLTKGGRVLNVVGRSKKDLRAAINKAYENVKKISFENEYYRNDIGSKGL